MFGGVGFCVRRHQRRRRQTIGNVVTSASRARRRIGMVAAAGLDCLSMAAHVGGALGGVGGIKRGGVAGNNNSSIGMARRSWRVMA